MGVQLLPPALHKQLFPGAPLPGIPKTVLDISLRHLDHNGLHANKAGTVGEFEIDLPPLQGSNIREHFLRLGKEVAEPYLTIATDFANEKLPEMPHQWVTDRYGWTKYHADGTTEAVEDLGDERAVVFDVETTYKISPFSVMATAASRTAWYSWLSPAIFQDRPDALPEYREGWRTRHPDSVPHHLIPLFPPQAESAPPRIVIGHNVGYDRARSKDEYSLEGTSTRWLDTLALHVATRGITSAQRPAFMKHRKFKEAKLSREKKEARAAAKAASGAAAEEEEEDDEATDDGSVSDAAVEFEPTFVDGASEDAVDKGEENAWADVTAMNSLAEVARLHLGITVDKSTRDRFGDPDLTHASDLRPELQKLLGYCAEDVRITHAAYAKIFPLFLESCPHPATFAGVLNMGSAFLPVDEGWERYLESAEGKYQELSVGVKAALRSLAEKARKEGLREGDPWSEQLDWTPKAARWADPSPTGADSSASAVNDDGSVDESAGESQTSVASTDATSGADSDSGSSDGTQAEAEGSAPPRWLTNLATPSDITSTASTRNLLPLLLQMKFAGYPVIQTSSHGWAFLAPSSDADELKAEFGDPLVLQAEDERAAMIAGDGAVFAIPAEKEGSKRLKLVGPGVKKLVNKGRLTSPYEEELKAVLRSDIDDLQDKLWELARGVQARGNRDTWAAQLDWSSSGKSGSPFA